jgi:GNAT superfamily N-acetyltransferase
MVAGLSSRPPTRADAQAVTELVIACDIEEFGAPDFELDDLLADWNRPGFDLQRHAVVVVDGERIVAYAGFARPDYADVYVHPDYRNRGIGSELLAWTERHALEQFEPGAEIRLGQVVTANRGGARTLLERAGYEPVAYGSSRKPPARSPGSSSAPTTKPRAGCGNWPWTRDGGAAGSGPPSSVRR